MDADRADRAAAEIWRCWKTGSVIPALPDGLRPGSRREGYAIQAHLAARSPEPIAGWKIAATSKAGQAHIGVDGPLAGRLHADRVYPSGSTLPFGHNRMAVAEPEFAFRLGRDLPPRADAYEVDEVLAAVGTLHGAIEVPDSRFAAFETAGDAQLIADNACAHEFVLGDAMLENWRSMDLAEHPVVISIAGEATHEGVGANVLGDPRIALCWIANELSREGIGLLAGQVVTTGTCATPIPIRPGVSVSVDYGPLGRAKVDFAIK